MAYTIVTVGLAVFFVICLIAGAGIVIAWAVAEIRKLLRD